MKLGRVIGTVVASVKESALSGTKLLVVEECDVRGAGKGSYVVAVDAVGAGPRDVVLTAAGSSARQTKETRERPVDAVVMAIVDIVEAEGQVVYRKGGGVDANG